MILSPIPRLLRKEELQRVHPTIFELPILHVRDIESRYEPGAVDTDLGEGAVEGCVVEARGGGGATRTMFSRYELPDIPFTGAFFIVEDLVGAYEEGLTELLLPAPPLTVSK